MGNDFFPQKHIDDRDSCGAVANWRLAVTCLQGAAAALRWLAVLFVYVRVSNMAAL